MQTQLWFIKTHLGGKCVSMQIVLYNSNLRYLQMEERYHLNNQIIDLKETHLLPFILLQLILAYLFNILFEYTYIILGSSLPHQLEVAYCVGSHRV